MIFYWRHYQVLAFMFIGAIFGMILDFVTLCCLGQFSFTNRVYQDYKGYMSTRRGMIALFRLNKTLDKILKRGEKNGNNSSKK